MDLRARRSRKSWRWPTCRPGIVRFYFDSKDAMLVASLAYLAAEFEERVMVPVAQLKDTPVAALERLVDLYLDPDIASPRKVSVWYSFWGEASSRQEYYDICGRKDEDFAALVRDLIERVIAHDGRMRIWMPMGSRSGSWGCWKCCGRESRFRARLTSIARPPRRSAWRFCGRCFRSSLGLRGEPADARPAARSARRPAVATASAASVAYRRCARC